MTYSKTNLHKLIINYFSSNNLESMTLSYIEKDTINLCLYLIKHFKINFCFLQNDIKKSNIVLWSWFFFQAYFNNMVSYHQAQARNICPSICQIIVNVSIHCTKVIHKHKTIPCFHSTIQINGTSLRQFSWLNSILVFTI